MKKSIIKNYLYNSGYQILALLVPLITTPYVSRILGADNIGIYEYVYAISQYFVLFGCIGLNVYGQREIAYCGNDTTRRSKVFFELVILRLITMCLAIVSFTIVAFFSSYRTYYFLSLFTLGASLIDISWLYQGLEEFKITVTRNIIVKLIGVAIIFLFVKSESDLWIYFLSHSLTLFLGNLTLWMHLNKYVDFRIKLNFDIVKHIKGTLILFFPQIAVSVYTILDKTMLGALVNTTQVGYYSQSEKIVKIAMTVVTSMGVVMLPRVSKYYAENNQRAIKESIYKSARFVFFLSLPMVFGIVAVAKFFVPWFYGGGYEPVITLLPIISPVILIIGLSNVLGTQYLIPVQKQKEYTISICCGAITNFILNMILIRYMEAIGASIATVCAEVVVTIVQMNYVKKDFSILKLISQMRNYLVSSIIMFIIVKIIQVKLGMGTISLLTQCIMGVFVYTIMLLILKDAFFKEYLDKLIWRYRSLK